MSEDNNEPNTRRDDEEDSSLTFSVANPPVSVGTQIGPYKLLSVLVKAVFGIVYLAEQKKPVRRQVALKS